MKELKTENDVKDIVKAWFESHGAWHYAPIQNGLGVHGIHDRLGGIPLIITPAMVGKQIALLTTVEAKRPGRRKEDMRGMSRHQFNHMQAIHLAGGLTTVCDGYEDLELLERRLKELTGS